MTDTGHLVPRYDRAASGWGDKMRALGYADAYLGFLSAGERADPTDRVCDVGCGTGAFAEAWLGIYGPQSPMTLLEPSATMLARAKTAVSQRATQVEAVQSGIADFQPSAPFDHLLMAHVIEHIADPTAALRRIRTWAKPGGRLWLAVSKPHWCNTIIWMQWRHRAFREDAVAAILADAGWRLDYTYAFPSGPPSRTSRGYAATAI